MAWTQADIDKLKTAMAKGVKSVRYVSGQVDYQSVDDMLKVLDVMENEVNPARKSQRRVARFVRGF